jgi:hypothetical protein
MADQLQRKRLETEAVVIGYAMSRLDDAYLNARKCSTWTQAFSQAAHALSIRPTSLKNLRDEFDPIHPNSRQGWHKRPLRPNREQVLYQFREVSDDALLEFVAQTLARNTEATAEAIDSLAGETRPPAHNVAERLLTGRLAEEHFLTNSESIISVPKIDVIDLRQSACGFDFGVRHRPDWAIEVKGLKEARGGIQFTDREWTEAKRREENYWLVIVGNLSTKPFPRVIRNPRTVLDVSCKYQKSIAVVWQSIVSVSLRR